MTMQEMYTTLHENIRKLCKSRRKRASSKIKRIARRRERREGKVRQ